jgi:hypothetical protein
VKHFFTVDEIWVYHYDPELKRQSKEWRHKGSLPPRKFCITTLAGKIMETVFWNFEGVLLVDYLPRGHTITDEY